MKKYKDFSEYDATSYREYLLEGGIGSIWGTNVYISKGFESPSEVLKEFWEEIKEE